MSSGVTELFDEYTARFARGEHPDPVVFLDRAGQERDELREMIDGFLRTAPPPEPTPEMVEVFAAWMEGESPLLELRRSKGARRDDVIDALVAELGIDRSKRGKVAEYYHRMESGLLSLARVDGRVFAALAKALGVRLSDLAFPGPPAAPAASAYLRSTAAAAEVLQMSLGTGADESDGDEVDELFGVPGD